MRFALIAGICLVASTVFSQETGVKSVEPVTVPAVAEKTFGQITLARTAYVHPGLADSSATGWGSLHFRVADGLFLSLSDGYQLAPDPRQHSVTLDVKKAGIRSSVFRIAFKAYRDALRLLAAEDIVLRQIEQLEEQLKEGEKTSPAIDALKSRLVDVRKKLNIPTE